MKGTERLAALLMAAALPLAALDAAHAERWLPVQMPPVREACLEDYRRFCWGVPPGGGRIVLCLNANADRLSQRCFQALTGRGLVYAGCSRPVSSTISSSALGCPRASGAGCNVCSAARRP